MPTPNRGLRRRCCVLHRGPAVIGDELQRPVEPGVDRVIGGLERKQQQPSTDRYAGVEESFGGVE